MEVEKNTRIEKFKQLCCGGGDGNMGDGEIRDRGKGLFKTMGLKIHMETLIYKIAKIIQLGVGIMLVPEVIGKFQCKVCDIFL